MFLLCSFSFAMITLLVGTDGKNVGGRPDGGRDVYVTLRSGSVALVPIVIPCSGSISFAKLLNV